MYENSKSVLMLKSEAFSGRIVKMIRYLNDNSDRVLSPLYNQILRSGTSIAANIGEAQYAQSRADFITKLHIAAKEANETRKWLKNLLEGNAITIEQYKSMDNDCNEILSILVSSLKTSKRNAQIVINS
ncbi:MAG: four helix bundle protein [Bacteroidaceae bacterium]|nr:four helix bundle protein [Bacteroidaceae bacterium]